MHRNDRFTRRVWGGLGTLGIALGALVLVGCEEGAQVSPELGRECQDATECSGDLVCLTDFPNGYCSEACTENSDCERGVCRSETCLALCSSDNDCRDGYSCVHVADDRGCAPPARGYHGLGDGCVGDADCAGELTCQVVGDGGRQCTESCTSVLNCGVGAVCVQSQCRRTCDQDADCHSDQVCVSTPDGRVCASEPARSPLGGPCEGDGDCDDGLTCLTDAPGGYCTRECGGAGDCPDGVCHDGFCFVGCSPSADEVDLLFVIDDSSGMDALQQELLAAAPTLINALDTAGTDYRIGVVSTDVSTGSYEVVNCNNLGGALQNTPRQGGCEAPTDLWISPTNVTNPVAAFGCIAELGGDGCGFEQPLEALQLALSDAVNPGFIRAGAHLMIVLFTTEDDCSAQDQDIFDANATQFGEFTSFRCFDHGIECDGPGPTYTNCRTKGVTSGGVLYPISRYVAQLEGLKGDLSLVTVVAIAGPEVPVQTGLDGNNNPTIMPSCVNVPHEAQPGIRLKEFLDATYGHFFPICGLNFGDAWQPLIDQVSGGGCRGGYQCSTVTEGSICEPG